MTYEVTLDLSKSIVLTHLNMAVGDEGNVIKATFTNGSTPYPGTGTTPTVKFGAYKPDGTIIFANTTESDGTYSFTDESGQLCLVKGKVLCRFIITEGSGSDLVVKNTPWFTVVVNNSSDVTPSAIVESDDDLAALNELVDRLNPVINDIFGLLAKFPIDTVDIKNKAVKAGKIDDGAVVTRTIGDGQVTEGKIDAQLLYELRNSYVPLTRKIATIPLSSNISAAELYENMAGKINPPLVTVGVTSGMPAQYGKTSDGDPVYCSGLNTWVPLAKKGEKMDYVPFINTGASSVSTGQIFCYQNKLYLKTASGALPITTGTEITF